MQQQSQCHRWERTRTSHCCCISIQRDQTQRGAGLAGGCRGISLPDVPCQLCNADMQCRVPCLCQKNVLNGEQGEESAQGVQAGELPCLAGLEQSKSGLG